MPIILDPKLLTKLFPPKLKSLVKRSTTTYLPAQGWQLTDGVVNPRWEGYYRTKFGSFKGRIDPRAEPKHCFAIYNPPAPLRKHHWSCFIKRQGETENGWYSVHLLPFPNDLDSGVLAIERVIHEAFVRQLGKTA
jgi:hypothetical protein